MRPGILRILLPAILLAPACHKAAPRAFPLTDALLALGGDSGDPDGAASRATLVEAAAQIERAWRGRPAARPEEILGEVVFGALGFSREVDDPDLRFQRLPAVLAGRRGSCYGLAALYLALGERLGPAHGFTLAGVLVPGHLFVVVRDGVGARNVELLRRGEVMPESWYRKKYDVPDARAYLRPLTAAELLAVFDYNLGNDRRIHGRLPEAAAAYGRAAAAFPEFAEAQASLGLVHHLQGNLPAALAAYQAARAANPHLPGLERNVELLRAEMAATSTPSPRSLPPATPAAP